MPLRTRKRFAGSGVENPSDVWLRPGASEKVTCAAGPWLAPIVAAPASKRTSASDGVSLVSEKVGAVPPTRTAICSTPSLPSSIPTKSTIAGSGPPDAGTLAGPVRSSPNLGRTTRTSIVSGSYPAASATTSACSRLAPSTPCSQNDIAAAPASTCPVASEVPTTSPRVLTSTAEGSSVRKVTLSADDTATGRPSVRSACRPAGCVRSAPRESFGSATGVRVSVRLPPASWYTSPTLASENDAVPATPVRMTLRLAGTPSAASGRVVARNPARSRKNTQICASWSAPIVAAVARKVSVARSWSFAKTSNSGAMPPARTAIGRNPPASFAPTVTSSTGSAPPLAATVLDPTRVSRAAGCAIVTRIVSGSYPGASAMRVTSLPTVPSRPCSQKRALVAPDAIPTASDPCPIVAESGASRRTEGSSVRSVTAIAAGAASRSTSVRSSCSPAGCPMSAPSESRPGDGGGATTKVTPMESGATPLTEEEIVMVAL